MESPDHTAGSAEPAQVSVSAIYAAGRCPRCGIKDLDSCVQVGGVSWVSEVFGDF